MFSPDKWFTNPSTGFYPHTISQSLRFNDGDSAYLTFDPSSSTAGTWTVSFWVKRGALSNSTQYIFYSGAVNARGGFYFLSDDRFGVSPFNSSGANMNRFSVPVYRDPSAWYHIVITANAITTSNLSTNLVIYVNGVAIETTQTSASSATGGDRINDAQAKRIGSLTPSGGQHFDGYLAEWHWIDGTVYDQNNFGEFKDGVWIAKEVSGLTYGAAGYYLNFADSSDIGNNALTTDGTNDWSVTNLAATDVVSDSPTNTFCTLNPLTHGTYPTLSEGNLKIASVYSADLCGVTSTWFPTTGKWYWEIHSEGSTASYPYFGITDQKRVLTNSTKGSFYSVAWLRNGNSAAASSANTFMGTITKNNVTSWTNNDIIMFALDVDARKLWIGKNGTWDSSGDPAGGSGEDASWTEDTGVSPSFMGYNGQGLASVFNFGQDGTFNGNQTAQGNADGNGVGDFYYSPPTGFLAMATSNLDITIGPGQSSQSDDNFNTVLYTGDADNDVTVTNTFAADWVWLKSRSASSTNHYLQDIVRGFGASKSLSSNATGTEGYNGGAPSSQNIVTSSSSLRLVSTDLAANSVTYVAWTWKAGGTAASNSDGSVSSTVSANTDAGFSIVQYEGLASGTQTVGHGLNSAPELIIFKNKDDTSSWVVYSDIVGTSGFSLLNSDGAGTNTSDVAGTFNSTAPTANVFTVGTNNAVGGNGETIIAYCFHSVEGYSKVDKYLGNADANGPFVFTGFRPAFVLLRVTDTSNAWFIYDNKREGYNEANDTLSPNYDTIEDSSYKLDLLSNGFKIRGTSNAHNPTGKTFLYYAIAEAPFKFSNAR
jgi:hypothetical protein